MIRALVLKTDKQFYIPAVDLTLLVVTVTLPTFDGIEDFSYLGLFLKLCIYVCLKLCINVLYIYIIFLFKALHYKI